MQKSGYEFQQPAREWDSGTLGQPDPEGQKTGTPVPAPPQPAEDWRSLPYGPRRGDGFRLARMVPGACSCCAGLRWWRGAGEAGPMLWRCETCHPPPLGLAIVVR